MGLIIFRGRQHEVNTGANSVSKSAKNVYKRRKCARISREEDLSAGNNHVYTWDVRVTLGQHRFFFLV